MFILFGLGRGKGWIVGIILWAMFISLSIVIGERGGQ